LYVRQIGNAADKPVGTHGKDIYAVVVTDRWRITV